jgi:hypothetical protein
MEMTAIAIPLGGTERENVMSTERSEWRHLRSKGQAGAI